MDIEIHAHGHTYTTDSPVEGQQVGQEQQEQQQLKVGPCYGIPLNGEDLEHPLLLGP